MNEAEPTREELWAWLAELAEESEYEIEAGTFTSSEWADEYDVTTKTALQKIKRLIKLEVVEPCKTDRKNVHGVVSPTWGYRIREMAQ